MIADTALAWKLPALAAVRSFGFMIGFELDTRVIEACAEFRKTGKPPSIWLVQQLMDAGLLTVAAGPGVVRWLAPMNTTEAEALAGLEIMRSVLGGLR